MRKRVIGTVEPDRAAPTGEWLDLERLATVELTSEDSAHPIERALAAGHAMGGIGWRAASPGTQSIRVLFDEPQRVRRIWLHFMEPTTERTQEFVVRWSPDRGASFRDVVRQQWNFSPPAGAEIEDYRVDLADVTIIELVVTPDIGGGDVSASLAGMRIG